MFDFSLGKLLIVALIALIVLGPDKLPGAARTVGALIRRLRSGWDSVRAEVERELEVDEIRRAARQAAADAEAVQTEASTTLKHLNEELDKVREIRHQLADSAVDAEVTTPETVAIAVPEARVAVGGDHAVTDIGDRQEAR
ncbi:MAG TPA: Sec-independent protein translocase protein TatB [Rhodanobacteraceae bacterium]